MESQPKTPATTEPIGNMSADELRSLYHDKSTRPLHSRLTFVANIHLRLEQWAAHHKPPQQAPLLETDNGLVWLNRATRRKLKR